MSFSAAKAPRVKKNKQLGGPRIISKNTLIVGLLALLAACQHTTVEKSDDIVGLQSPYAWYWEAKVKGDGVVSDSVEAITFSGRDFVTIRHRHIPLNEPLPEDVVELADKYCGRLGKFSILRDISPRYSNSAAFLCLTEEELKNFVPMKTSQAGS